MKRMRYAQAWKLLKAYCRHTEGKDPSSNKSPAKKPNESGKRLRWWTENDETCPPYDSPRSRAYLAAYMVISGNGALFYGTGIPLSDGYMWPDRGVMKALLFAHMVAFDDEKGLFLLSDAGRALIDGLPSPESLMADDKAGKQRL